MSSRSGVATLRTAIHLLLTYLLTRRSECKLRYRPSNQRYRLGQWTDCAAFHPSQAVATFGSRDLGSRDLGSGSRGFTSVIGYRRRSVDCIDVSGSTVDKRFATTALITSASFSRSRLLRSCFNALTTWTSAHRGKWGHLTPVEK